MTTDSSLFPGENSLPGENSQSFKSNDHPQEYVLASWGKRVGATLIDSFIVAIILAIIVVPLFIVLFGGLGDLAFINSDFNLVPILLYFVIAIAVGAVYYPFVIARTNGQTFGKKTLGIRIVRTDFQPMTFGFAALREIGLKMIGGSILGSIPILGWFLVPLDYLWPLWDKENRAVHDMIVQTRVVEA